MQLEKLIYFCNNKFVDTFYILLVMQIEEVLEKEFFPKLK